MFSSADGKNNKGFCQINKLFTCLVLAIKSITEELYQHFKLEIILSLSAFSKATNLKTFFTIKSLFIPLRAKRVGEFIEITHKKFHPPVY